MKKLSMGIFIAVLIVGVCFSTPSYANSFYLITDRTSYTGTLTQYSTLSDAQTHNNPVGTYSIPDRVTAAPYNTPNRDLTLFIVNNTPSVYSNYTQIMTAWFYTTDFTQEAYSGYGNPNNTNRGFFQIADAGSTTVTNNGQFGNFDGTYYTTFKAQVSGQNANYANSLAWLWEAPGRSGGGEAFISYALDVTLGGLQGTAQNGVVTSIGHPTLVTGTLQALFQYSDTKFYDVNFTLGMDNWAYAQGSNLNGAFIYQSEFGQAPLPSTVLLVGSGLTGLAFWRRRRAASKS